MNKRTLLIASLFVLFNVIILADLPIDDDYLNAAPCRGAITCAKGEKMYGAVCRSTECFASIEDMYKVCVYCKPVTDGVQ